MCKFEEEEKEVTAAVRPSYHRGERTCDWGEGRAGGGASDGQLEGDVHLSFLSQRHDFRQLYHL